MERQQVLSIQKTSQLLRSRLYEPKTGTCYNGYRQLLFRKQLTVAYVFSRKVPEFGGSLINRDTDERYRVKNIIQLAKGEHLDSYELVLGHL